MSEAHSLYAGVMPYTATRFDMALGKDNILIIAATLIERLSNRQLIVAYVDKNRWGRFGTYPNMQLTALEPYKPGTFDMGFTLSFNSSSVEARLFSVYIPQIPEASDAVYIEFSPRNIRVIVEVDTDTKLEKGVWSAMPTNGYAVLFTF